MKKSNSWTGRTALIGSGVVSMLGLATAGVSGAQPIAVQVNGNALHFSDAQPMQAGGRVLVPMRSIFEALGATVQWDPATKVIHADRQQTTVAMVIGQRGAKVNGQPVELDQPPMLYHGATFVPLRFVGEALGSQVRWAPGENTIFITSTAPAAATTTAATAGGPAETMSLPPATSLAPDLKRDASHMQVNGNFAAPVPFSVITELPRIKGTAKALRGGTITRVGVQLARAKGDRGYDYWNPDTGWGPKEASIIADYDAAAGEWSISKGLPTAGQLPPGHYYINSIAYDENDKPAFLALAGFTVPRGDGNTP